MLAQNRMPKQSMTAPKNGKITIITMMMPMAGSSAPMIRIEEGFRSGVGKSKDILGNGITDLLC